MPFIEENNPQLDRLYQASTLGVLRKINAERSKLPSNLQVCSAKEFAPLTEKK
jgi:hypothetical protein